MIEFFRWTSELGQCQRSKFGIGLGWGLGLGFCAGGEEEEGKGG